MSIILGTHYPTETNATLEHSNLSIDNSAVCMEEFVGFKIVEGSVGMGQKKLPFLISESSKCIKIRQPYQGALKL